jgi:hypothetical protein
MSKRETWSTDLFLLGSWAGKKTMSGIEMEQITSQQIFLGIYSPLRSVALIKAVCGFGPGMVQKKGTRNRMSNIYAHLVSRVFEPTEASGCKKELEGITFDSKEIFDSTEPAIPGTTPDWVIRALCHYPDIFDGAHMEVDWNARSEEELAISTSVYLLVTDKEGLRRSIYVTTVVERQRPNHTAASAHSRMSYYGSYDQLGWQRGKLAGTWG